MNYELEELKRHFFNLPIERVIRCALIVIQQNDKNRKYKHSRATFEKPYADFIIPNKFTKYEEQMEDFDYAEK
jgi:hypothetical protein